MNDSSQLQIVRSWSDIEGLPPEANDVQCRALTSEMVHGAVSRCLIKRLELRDCDLSRLGETHDSTRWSTIRSLRVLHSDISDMFFNFIEELINLDELDLSVLSNVSRAGLERLRSLSQLRKLQLSLIATSFSDPFVTTDDSLAFLSSLKRLEDLELTDIDISGSALGHISTHLCMTDIALQFMQRFEPHFLSLLPKDSPLQGLDIRYCKNLDDSGLVYTTPA